MISISGLPQDSWKHYNRRVEEEQQQQEQQQEQRQQEQEPWNWHVEILEITRLVSIMSSTEHESLISIEIISFFYL